MLYAAHRLRETLFFYRREFPALARILVPVLLPACLLLEYRIWAVLGGDPTRIMNDVLTQMLSMLISLFAQAVTITHATGVLREQSQSDTAVRRAALLAMPALLLVVLLVCFAILGGLVMLILPGLWLAGCLAPAVVLVIAEGLSPIQALQVSIERFRPMVWQILLTMVLTTLLMFALLLGLGVIYVLAAQLPLWSRILGWAALETGNILILQIMPILLVRFYDLQKQPVA